MFGLDGPDIDAEMIFLTARLWQQLGVAHKVKLELNSLGSNEARAVYRDLLVEYFERNSGALDEDSTRRLHTNPLRILDSKNPEMQDLISQAPKMAEHLDTESREHFTQLCAMLDDVGIVYHINPCLVRGLDYYNRTVFEWVTDQLGAQGTICAGGRYDGLVQQLGGRATPAVGFAMGLERIIALLDEDFVRKAAQLPHAYFIMLSPEASRRGWAISEKLRNELPALRLLMNSGNGSLKSQMKRADKSEAEWVIILGDDELAAGQVSIKHLRDASIAQQNVAMVELATWLRDRMISN